MRNRRLWRAVLLALPLVAVPTVINAGWEATKKVDPLSDKISTTAMSTKQDGLFTQSAIVSCRDNYLVVYFGFGRFLNSKEDVPVKYRIDKEPMVADKWGVSTDGTAVFANDEIELARQMITGKTIIVEAEDFRGVDYRINFSLAGASKGITTVMNECGLKPRGLYQEIKGLNRIVATDMNLWGSDDILNAKKILTSIGEYSGTLDSNIDTIFALAVQKNYDQYMDRCSNGTNISWMCSKYETSIKYGNKIEFPSVKSALAEQELQTNDSGHKQLGSEYLTTEEKKGLILNLRGMN